MKEIWDPSVPVERSAYYNEGEPIAYRPIARKQVDLDLPTIVDLFCGCGGISTGFEMAGFKAILPISEAHPIQILAGRFSRRLRLVSHKHSSRQQPLGMDRWRYCGS